jgi:hypothetical protein
VAIEVSSLLGLDCDSSPGVNSELEVKYTGDPSIENGGDKGHEIDAMNKRTGPVRY